MSESPQGHAASSTPISSTLGTQVSSSGVMYDLNGVMVEVVTASYFPADCDPDHPEWCWPTTALAYNLRVKMQNGEMWRLNRMPVYLEDGRIQISLRSMTSTRMSVFNVAVEDFDKPIWNMGKEMPPPVVVEPPTPVDPSEPMPEPKPPQTPVEPTEPPVEG